MAGAVVDDTRVNTNTIDDGASNVRWWNSTTGALSPSLARVIDARGESPTDALDRVWRLIGERIVLNSYFPENVLYTHTHTHHIVISNVFCFCTQRAAIAISLGATSAPQEPLV